MTPERIWAEYYGTDVGQGTWVNYNYGGDSEEYIRADLVQRMVDEAVEKEREKLDGLLKRVIPALNCAFAAGIEEREGGSARRQAKLLAPERELRADIAAAIRKGER